MLAHPELPMGLIARCLDVLKEIMPSERDLIRIVVEIIIELREGEEPEPVEALVSSHTVGLAFRVNSLTLEHRRPIRCFPINNPKGKVSS